jgi:hypothetical protein
VTSLWRLVAYLGVLTNGVPLLLAELLLASFAGLLLPVAQTLVLGAVGGVS